VGALSTGSTKALNLQNGTLVLNDAVIDVDVNSGGGDFTIPSTAALTVQAGTVRATASGTGAGNGLRLDGKLTISGGNVILDGGAAANNYLEYGSGGSSAIVIMSGNLVVGSQLRRNTLSDDGVINYTQSGGTAIFGANAAPVNSRGVFEIINTGAAGTSSFNLSGATTTFAIVNGQSSPTQGTFIIGSNVATSVTSDPFIDFGFNGDVNGSTYQNDLNESYEINAAIALPNIRIDNSNFNSPVLRMVVQPLTITDNLEILNGGTLVSNNFALTINNGFTNDGTYTPGSNTTIFNGGSQSLGGTTNTTFNDLNVNASSSVTLNNPITINGNLNILTGQLDDAGNRISLLGNLSMVANHVSDGSGNGGVSMDGLARQEIRLPSNTATIDKLIVNNINDVSLFENGGVAVTLNVNEELAIENGLFELGDNRLIFDADANVTTSSSFSATRMISVNGVKKSDGVEKQFLASTALPNFEIPVGTPGKYTPVTLDVITSTDPGSILVKPIDAIHPSATNVDALNYYWLVTTNPSSVTGFQGSISFQYEESDANGPGQNESSWANRASRLIAPNWFKPPGNLVDISTNTMTFSNADLSSFGGTNFDGEFTIGNNIPNELARYRSVGNGNWNDPSNWQIDIDGDGFDDGNGVPQPGTLVIIDSGDEVVMGSGTDNDQNVFSIQIDGTLDINDSDGHNFGDVTGSGTLKVANQTLPGGNYDSFFMTTGGSIDLAGTGNYTISPDFANGVRSLMISGGGVKTLPALTVNIGPGGLIISDGAILDNTTNNNPIIVNGDVTITNGNFNLGNASASLQAQNFTINSGVFNTSGGAIDLSDDLNITGGTFNAGSVSHTIGGDLNYNTAATFDRGTGRITFDGGTTQNITTNAAATLDFHNLDVDKSAGELVLSMDVTVQINNRLGLLNGSVINTQSSGTQLRLVGTATYEAGSDGFINGALFKDLTNTASSFTFRVGKGSSYKPVTIDPLDASYSGDITWEAEYYNQNPTTFSSGENSIDNLTSIETNADTDEQVEEIRDVEFWRIDDGGGNGDLEEVTLDISNIGSVRMISTTSCFK